MATKASHKNLSGAFSPSQPDRGSKLAGLLAPGRAPAPAPEAPPEQDGSAEVQPTSVTTRAAGVPEAPAPAPAVQAASPAAAAVTTPVRSRPTRIPRLKGARGVALNHIQPDEQRQPQNDIVDQPAFPGECNSILQELTGCSEIIPFEGNIAKDDPRQTKRWNKRASGKLDGCLAGLLCLIQTTLLNLHLRRSAARMNS